MVTDALLITGELSDIEIKRKKKKTKIYEHVCARARKKQVNLYDSVKVLKVGEDHVKV